MLLTGKIAKEHVNQPAFSYALIDFHQAGEGLDRGREASFHAGIKIVFRNGDNIIKAMAIHGPADRGN
jgi:hypothetical protein